MAKSYACNDISPLELQGMDLKAKRRTDFRNVQTSNLLYYSGFASVIETPAKCSGCK
jgi:hypothetical protein